MKRDERLWTLDELEARVAAALADGSADPASGRVNPVPDARVIRYYATIGLVDRPVAFRGRVALYRRRHLLQLVAVKRLQADGLALAEVQRRLAGLGDAALARIARVPAEAEAPGPLAAERATAPAPAPDRRAFWATAPARPAATAASVTAAQAVHLRPGVTLLLDAARPLTPEDLAALEQASGALVEVLRTRGLAPAGEESP